MIWVGANLCSLRCCDLICGAGFLPTHPRGWSLSFLWLMQSVFSVVCPSQDWRPFTPGWPWENSTGTQLSLGNMPGSLWSEHYSCSRGLQRPSLCILGRSALFLSCQCPVALATATSVPFCLCSTSWPGVWPPGRGWSVHAVGNLTTVSTMGQDSLLVWGEVPALPYGSLSRCAVDLKPRPPPQVFQKGPVTQLL